MFDHCASGPLLYCCLYRHHNGTTASCTAASLCRSIWTSRFGVGQPCSSPSLASRPLAFCLFYSATLPTKLLPEFGLQHDTEKTPGSTAQYGVAAMGTASAEGHERPRLSRNREVSRCSVNACRNEPGLGRVSFSKVYEVFIRVRKACSLSPLIVQILSMRDDTYLRYPLVLLQHVGR